MRAVEIALGVLVLAAAGALAFGLADQVLLLPPIGFGATLAPVSFALLLIVHGVIGRRLRTGGTHVTALRVLGRTGFTVVAALAAVAAVPALVAPFNLVSVAGFPLGFYLAAQGALLALGILAFRAAQGLDAAEAEGEGAAGSEGDG